MCGVILGPTGSTECEVIRSSPGQTEDPASALHYLFQAITTVAETPQL
jgi:hypothetical protein